MMIEGLGDSVMDQDPVNNATGKNYRCISSSNEQVKTRAMAIQTVIYV